MMPAYSGCSEGLALVSVYDLKPKFQNLLRPLCTGLARAGVTAAQIDRMFHHAEHMTLATDFD